jgi:flavorubredoxin
VSTTIAEITDGIYRVSTYTDEIPGGFTFNQFLVDADEPLLFHCGLRTAFPPISEAVASVRPLSDLRWLSFGHWEADESGAMNQWLAAAPHATVTVGTLGEMVSGSDQADRPICALADGEVLDLGGKRIRWLDTPHVPHGWDAGVIYEETTKTLFCGDLLSQTGAAAPVTTEDVVGPALAAEDMFHATALTPNTAPTIRRLAELHPTTLAIMHGASFAGDCEAALRAAADEYENRLRSALDRP